MKKKRALTDRQEMDSIIGLTIRGFIVIILFFAVLFGLEGCGGGGSGAYSSSEGFSVESSEIDNHTHSIWVKWIDLRMPPATGIAYESGKHINGHSHTVYLTQQQLQTANSGTAVTVNSSITEGHFHIWVIP